MLAAFAEVDRLLIAVRWALAAPSTDEADEETEEMALAWLLRTAAAAPRVAVVVLDKRVPVEASRRAAQSI